MKIIGHRGARNEAPENTVPGFVHAHKQGCMHFELDVQLSSDRELVVYHDKSLKRTSGLLGKIKHTPYSQLKTIDARLNTPGWHSPCYIPHLQEVVDCVPKVKSWQIEVKTDTRHALKIVIRKLQQFFLLNDFYDMATVTSSNKWLLKEIKNVSPHIQTGYVAESRYRDSVKTSLSLGCSLLVLNERLATPKLIKYAQRNGLEVSCWTVNNAARMAQLRKLGVDSIITDEPSQTIQQYFKNQPQ
jgi:glycerophosphoryl diester phosphodiesterase